MQPFKNVINNPLFKTPMFKYITLTVVTVMVLFLIYNYYQKIVKKQQNEPHIISAKKPQSGKDYFHVLTKDLPSTSHGHGYALSMWLWIDDFSYNKGKYRHIVHRGDFKMNSVQPGIWLHPTDNKLLVRFDNDGRKIQYDYTENKIFKSLNKDEGNHDKLHNVSLEQAQEKCSVSPSCLGFATVQNRYRKNHVDNAYYPITQEDTDLVSPGNDYHNSSYQQIGTYLKHTSSVDGTHPLGRMNPNNPEIAHDANISADIDNIPLNRWFHFTMSVNNQIIEIYIDGKLRLTRTSPSHIKNNNGNMYFSCPDGNSNTKFDFTKDDVQSGNGFGGYRINCQYFNKPLTDKEVSTIYYRGPSPYMLPDLTNYEKKIEDGMKNTTHLLDNVNISGKSFSPSEIVKHL